MSSLHTLDFDLEPSDNERLSSLCGQLDENLRQIERRLGVEINNRGNSFRVIGDEAQAQAAAELLIDLYEQTARHSLSRADLHLALHQHAVHKTGVELEKSADDFVVYTKRGPIRPRGRNQAHYIDQIRANDISFGVGPAGTGKTYLAVACAVDALERQQVRRIILTRPAVEAGEKLGFLPGDMAQKVDPYLRPLFDALYDLLGFEKVAKYMEKNVIEIAPLAFMRGRTLNESFIILDESQNTTVEQMKMLLTRVGFDSKAVITGDITQTDLPKGRMSGLRHAIEVLQNVDSIRFTFFTAEDVVRHPVVQRIVRAYEAWDKRQEQNASTANSSNNSNGDTP